MKMNEFEKLGLSNDVLNILEKAGFKEPTEIQKKTIPLILSGRDVIGSSSTGSGKTLAFASSIIENLMPNEHIQALILTPTRELAEQVATSIRKFARNRRLDVIAVYGGVDIQMQMRKIRRADIVVATPGRILDHLNRRTLRLDHVKYLVLDEVDRMFDMGFHKDVELILRECPKERQTMLFSATISSEIDYLAKKYTKNAVEFSVDNYVDTTKLKQIYYDVPTHLKFSLLVHLLKKETSDLEMVFCSTRRNVDFVTDNLKNLGINAKAIHGGLPQNRRLRILSEFHEKGTKVLVCTDVAARGLDIKGVSHVYNYDLPKTSDDYIHRIGRTARAGKIGKAISLLASRDYENFGMITRDESLNITLEKLPRIDTVHVNTNFGQGRSNTRPRQDSFRRDNSRGRPPGRPMTPQRGNYNRSRPQGGRSDNRGGGNNRGRSRPKQHNFAGRDNSRSQWRSDSRPRNNNRERPTERQGSSRGRDNSRGRSNRKRR